MSKKIEEKNQSYLKANGISEEKKVLLVDAWNYCDAKDKSTEFMLSYMADVANMDYDDVVDFVMNYTRTKKDFQNER